MQKLVEQFKLNKVLIYKHCLHGGMFTAVAVIFHLLIPGMLPYLPLVLIFNLLIYKTTEEATNEQLRILWQTLPVALPLALLITLFLRAYVWSIPLLFLLMMAIHIYLQLPRTYIFGGILILVAYFSTDSWLFYIIVTIDVLLFSLVAWKLSQPFYVQDVDAFKMLYTAQDKLFYHLMVGVLENRAVYVSRFFEGYNEMRLLYLDMEQEGQLAAEDLAGYRKLLHEMEEAYFYLRSLTDAPIKLTEQLLAAYRQAGVEVDVQNMLLGESPYLFHSKNLLRHYKRWQVQAKVLADRRAL